MLKGSNRSRNDGMLFLSKNSSLRNPNHNGPRLIVHLPPAHLKRPARIRKRQYTSQPGTHIPLSAALFTASNASLQSSPVSTPTHS